MFLLGLKTHTFQQIYLFQNMSCKNIADIFTWYIIVFIVHYSVNNHEKFKKA